MSLMPRRRIIILGALVAIAVLVVLPGYLATRPSFFSRLPGMAEKYEPWSTSTHVEAGCDGCHVRPTLLARTAYRTRMVGEFYLSFVAPSRVPKLFETPTNEACLSCHDDVRAISPKGDLQIPHRAHVQILKMECVECHNQHDHEPSPEGRHPPQMEGCLRCHDGDTAKDNCSACHTEKTAPQSHATPTWLVDHGTAQESDPECVRCHKWAERWCADCHSQRPASHGADWRAVHGDRVATHRSCEACHSGDFCDRCHGEVPQLNFDPTLTLVE
jgi:hypothetical protein